MLDNADKLKINPVILAIDTADEITGIAVHANGEIAAELNVAAKKGRDTILSEMTAKVLKSSGLNWADISAIAVNCGPGSFTGLRVGMAYAKGICYAQNLPLITIDNFHALAQSAGKQRVQIIPVIHARGDEVYAAIYRYEKFNLVTVREGNLYQYNDFAGGLEENCIMLGSGFRRHRREFLQLLGDKIIYHPADENISPVKWVAEEGLVKFFDRDFEKTGKIEPKYLQDFPKVK